MLAGVISMLIAIQSNFRTTIQAKTNLALAFKTAYRAGCAMGFALVSISLLVLLILIVLFKPTIRLKY